MEVWRKFCEIQNIWKTLNFYGFKFFSNQIFEKYNFLKFLKTSKINQIFRFCSKNLILPKLNFTNFLQTLHLCHIQFLLYSWKMNFPFFCLIIIIYKLIYIFNYCIIVHCGNNSSYLNIFFFFCAKDFSFFLLFFFMKIRWNIFFCVTFLDIFNLNDQESIIIIWQCLLILRLSVLYYYLTVW